MYRTKGHRLIIQPAVYYSVFYMKSLKCLYKSYFRPKSKHRNRFLDYGMAGRYLSSSDVNKPNGRRKGNSFLILFLRITSTI